MKAVIKDYIALTKPGIVRGNLVVAAAGFLLAAQGRIDIPLLLALLAGTGCVIASGCVYNNYIDRGIDANMVRTKQRALVVGQISGRSALIYGTLLGIIGFALLAAFTNPVTVGVGVVGWVFYVVLYGWAKRQSSWGTLVGSVPGATPPVAGYTAVTGSFDLAALLLFAILVCWQMPHFYAIAMYRAKEYAAAGIPVLPLQRGMWATKIHIMAYVVAFIAATATLTITGYTGYTYLIVMLLLGTVWLYKGIGGLHVTQDARWARGMFGTSLAVLMVFSVMISADVLLP